MLGWRSRRANVKESGSYSEVATARVWAHKSAVATGAATAICITRSIVPVVSMWTLPESTFLSDQLKLSVAVAAA